MKKIALLISPIIAWFITILYAMFVPIEWMYTKDMVMVEYVLILFVLFLIIWFGDIDVR